MTHYTLPWEVLKQANHRLLPVMRKGKAAVILAPEYRAAKEAAGYLLLAQHKGRPLYRHPVAVRMVFYPPDRIRRDMSNLQKLIEDAMTGSVYVDDSLIADNRWLKSWPDRLHARVEISVESLVSISEKLLDGTPATV